MITLLKFNGRNHPHSEILTCRQLHCLLALKMAHVATANSGHQQRFREHTWLEYYLRRGDPLSECLGRGRNARNSPLPLRSQKLIYYSRLSPHRAETLQKCRSTSSRTDCLAAADQRPLVTAMESRRSRRGPISTVLSSLQGGRVAVKRDVEELRKNMLVLPGTKIQYMKVRGTLGRDGLLFTLTS